MTISKNSLKNIIIVPGNLIYYTNDELIEKAFQEVIDNKKLHKSMNEKDELNIEKNDIYLAKYNASQEEIKKMCSFKCVIFNVPNLKDAPDFEKNNIKEFCKKELESSVELIIIFTVEQDVETICNFYYSIVEKNNDKIEEKSQQVKIE